MAGIAVENVGGARRSPLVWAAVCVAAGLVLGREWPGVWAWLAMALGTALAAALLRGRAAARPALTAAGLALVFTAAAWWSLRAHGLGSDLAIAAQARLAVLEGVVEGEVRHRIRSRGAMGGFDHRGPATSFVLRVDTAVTEQGAQPAHGGVLVTIREYDGRISPGDRVRCGGWLSAFGEPMNPGERDFGGFMAERGVQGRLSLKGRGNCQVLEPGAGLIASVARFRQSVMRRARGALDDAMPLETGGAASVLLRTLLLGEGREELGDLEAAFQHTGLTHLLSISGLHLAVLVAGAWWVVLTATGRPGVAIGVAMGALVSYTALLPPEVPLLRSAVMTGAACAALTSGRKISALAALCGAAVALLAWRPMDLFAAGFQLSFAIVGALVVFTPAVARALRGGEIDPLAAVSLWRRGRDRFTDALAVTIVAFTASGPLVAFHFQLLSPAALVMSLVMLPVGAAVLWLGYVKLLASLVAPPVGALLAHPLAWTGRLTTEAVRLAADLPGAAWWLPATRPAWAVGGTLVVAAILAGRWRTRPVAITAAALVCAAWLWWPTLGQRLDRRHDALTLNMLAVGDGSCYLLRSGGQTMLYDCGSANYLDITTAVVGPALRELGVMRVDTLVVTHPDTDHFSGALELVDQFAVGRVLTTQVFLDEQKLRPHSAPALLIDGLRRRGVEVEPVAAGWATRLGETEIEAIWPPAGRRFARHNDSSIVLSVLAAGRRLLLTGDIQHEAMNAMLRSGLDLRADVVELPHHGSYIPLAPQWVEAAAPSILLQSTGWARLREDRWAQPLAHLQRHITARHGMVSVHFGRDGRLAARRFLAMEAGVTDDLE